VVSNYADLLRSMARAAKRTSWRFARARRLGLIQPNVPRFHTILARCILPCGALVTTHCTLTAFARVAESADAYGQDRMGKPVEGSSPLASIKSPVLPAIRRTHKRDG